MEGTDENIYQEWNVLKPFGVEQTQIAGQDGQPTGGIQLKSSIPAGELINEGYIKPVEPVVPVEPITPVDPIIDPFF